MRTSKSSVSHKTTEVWKLNEVNNIYILYLFNKTRELLVNILLKLAAIQAAIIDGCIIARGRRRQRTSQVAFSCQFAKYPYLKFWGYRN